MAHVTCSTKGPTQVITVTNIDKVHSAATTVRIEPGVDLFHQEVKQLTHAPSISANTTTSTTKVVTTIVTITDIDPKATLLEVGASPLPSINASTPEAREGDHSIILDVYDNLTTLTPTTCSTECPDPEID
ncbi:hypothetical protein D1007_21158 [Hordeum vulgare]|nr:hypothetical protein D1007_21158 [Hordeum vulgare]